ALSGGIAARYFPTGSKSSKVIDACNVHRFQRGANAFNPPFETIREHPIPIEERIAPVLSCLAEIIGRDTGDNCGSSIGIELELLGIGPDVGRIVCDKNRNITDNLDAAPVAVGLQIEPLFEKKKLIEPLRFDLIVKLVASTSQGRRSAPYQRPFPLMPGRAVVSIFQGPEESIVVKPGSVLLSKRFEGAA